MPNLPGQEEIARNEHIGPGLTGDNIDAKKVANYVWNGSAWAAETQPGSGNTPDTTASGTVTAVSQTVTIATNGQSTVGIQVTGSFTGTLLVEGTTDGSTWSPTTVAALSNGTLQTSITGPFNGQSNVGGLSSLRLRATAFSAGTATVSLRASVGVSTIMLDNPLPAGTNSIGTVVPSGGDLTSANQQTKLTDGTNVVSVLKSDGTAAGQNAQIIAPTYLPIPINTTVTNAPVGVTDVGNYKSVSFDLTSISSGSITFQGSNDNSTWRTVALANVNYTGATTTTTTSSSGIYAGILNYRYFRINVSGTSVTITGTLVFFTMPTSQNITAVSQSGTWTVGANSATGSATPANAFLIGISSSGSLLQGLASANTTGDGNSGASTAATLGMVYNGATYDKPRTPTTFKTVQATASGNTALWTPTTGKKFRLMRFKVQITGNATLGGAAVLSVGLQDATTDIGVTHDVYVPAAALNTMTGYDSGWINLGNGKISAAANNVLNVNLSAAITAGNARVIVCGTEE